MGKKEIEYSLVNWGDRFLRRIYTGRTCEARQISGILYRACLKCGTLERAKARLIHQLNECNLYFEGILENVVVLRGDISQSNMGLESETYERLCQAVDTVIHSAAYVNHILQYEQHRVANVVGTKNVIDFCTTGTEKRLAHISTTGVNPTLNRPVREAESIEKNYTELSSGYCQSKWVAEQVVQRAEIPSIIFRAGEIGCDSRRKHYWGKTDALRMCLHMCFKIGSYPAEFQDRLIEITPVDVVAKSVVSIVDTADSDMKPTVNVSNPSQGITFKEFFKGLAVGQSRTWYNDLCRHSEQDSQVFTARAYFNFLTTDEFRRLFKTYDAFPNSLACNDLLLSLLPNEIRVEYEKPISELLLNYWMQNIVRL
mmetsp:Transcript_3342/g.7089  ORF Transcript_3342/g.7089 Transcript_3342/m.7089 type:complete len:370 (+) Transcript_3342:4628-5737(+)